MSSRFHEHLHSLPDIEQSVRSAYSFFLGNGYAVGPLRNFSLVLVKGVESPDHGALSSGIIDEFASVAQKPSGRDKVFKPRIAVFCGHLSHEPFSYVELVDYRS